MAGRVGLTKIAISAILALKGSRCKQRSSMQLRCKNEPIVLGSHLTHSPPKNYNYQEALSLLLLTFIIFRWRRLASTNIKLSKLGGKYAIQSHLIWVYYTVRRQKSASKLIYTTKFFNSACPYSYTICNFTDMEMQYICA